ncbi:NepR family anti-sigma factor [Sphingobium sp. AP50]|uniref:NepR family anti-sigma factor n=1 Tax=Sphingobium sp. AP50 TaxID=1884369 RepID=UPI000B82F8C0|nr:NepR family anti-sigma factor [Sphingobium sp. AP50]
MADDSNNAGIGTPEDQVKDAPAPSKRRAAAPAAKEDAHVSQVLRTVYERAVNEDIPSEMLDLLNKLD